MKARRFLASLNRNNRRVSITLVLVSGIILIILLLFLSRYRQTLFSQRERELKRMVTIALRAVQPTIDDYESGLLFYEDALTDVRNTIRRMTYESEAMENYIFMSSYDYRMLVQSLEPWMEDQYQGDLQDSRGNFYIRDLVDIARSPEGEGYVTYYYPHPGSDKPEKKISYVKGIDSLNCYIGTGMYVTDLNVVYKRYLLSPLLFILVTTLFVSFVMLFYILNPLTSCFRTLVDLFMEVSISPDSRPTVPISQFPDNSEEQEILRGFDEMLTALRDSESRWRYLYEESTGVRVITDRQGLVKDMNQSLLEQMGYRKEDVLGQPIESFTTAGSSKNISRMIGRVFDHGIEEAQDFSFLSRSEKTLTLMFSHSLYLPDHEGSEAILITGIDITNRRRAEIRAEDQKKQLIKADKLRSLGVLVAGVAHEINNPNQSILSNAPLLAEIWDQLLPLIEECNEGTDNVYVGGAPLEDVGARIDRYMAGIQNGSERIGKIVNDLKSFSSQDSEDMNSEVRLNSLVNSSISLCDSLIRKATDDFIVDLKEDIPPVKGNPHKLEQVLINLIQNGCQALENRSKSIHLKTRYSPENKEVHFILEDQGEGISAKDLDKITDPFYTTKRDRGGTGLGLSISLGIIEDHGGKIDFQSTIGTGTRVIVSLPEWTGSN